MLNRLGRIAHDHWKMHRPTDFAKIRDPISHFSRLGEEIVDRIEEIVSAMCPKSPIEYRQLANQIESEVLRDMLPTDEETEAQTKDEAVSPLG